MAFGSLRLLDLGVIEPKPALSTEMMVLAYD